MVPRYLMALSFGMIVIAGFILKDGGEVPYFLAGLIVGIAVAVFVAASIELWRIWKSRRK